MQEQLNYLLKKYSVNTEATLIDKETATVGSEVVSLLPWRFERRFDELKKLRTSSTVAGISTLRIISIGRASDDIYALLKRELDVARWLLDDEPLEVFAIGQGTALNVSIKMKNGVICTIELATTLEEKEERISKHELIAERGIACDMNVDTQVMQSSIYIFGKNNKKFTDVDAELFGLSIDEVASVRAAFELAKNNRLVDLHKSEAATLDKLVNLVKVSEAECRNLSLED